MKKVVNINLSGTQFTIDEDAYQKLEQYLNSINRHFSKSSGFEDIMYDIELRVAELFLEDKRGTNIITLEKVEAVQKIMGSPSDFGAEDPFEAPSNNETKRFFRDPDNKVIGGVASGLAAYYGMKSPTLLRSILAFLAICGVGILPYILLWILIPEAKTASDKLAMHGEQINIESIANAVEDGVNDIKDTITDFSKNFKSMVL